MIKCYSYLDYYVRNIELGTLDERTNSSMSKRTFSDLLVSEEKAVSLSHEYFDLQVEAKILPGEVDFNFRLRTADGTTYLLKVSRDDTSIEELQFQESLMTHLFKNDLPFSIPSLISNNQGDFITSLIDDQGIKRWIRLQSWVEGRMLADVNPRTPELYYNWGKTTGLLSVNLEGFDHEGAHRFYKWDPSILKSTWISLKGKTVRRLPYFFGVYLNQQQFLSCLISGRE